MKKTDLKKVIESTEAKLEKIENAQQELDQKITLTQVTIEKLETSIEQMRKIEASASKKKK
jgi:peptidoglycan hydrolase CwlO-like protein